MTEFDKTMILLISIFLVFCLLVMSIVSLSNSNNNATAIEMAKFGMEQKLVERKVIWVKGEQ